MLSEYRENHPCITLFIKWEHASITLETKSLVPRFPCV